MSTNRFARTELLLGPDAMAVLKKSRILVCGMGAVGSYAVEGLARSGIGFLRLVDFDMIRHSNMNRQLYAMESTLGRKKVEVAVERVRDINPDCTVEGLPLFLDEKTIPAVLADPFDVVIDAIDSLNPKIELIASARTQNIPIISSMGAATRTDPLAIRVGDISETRACPLARFVRRKLKKRGIADGVRCIYSEEPARPRVSPDTVPPQQEEREYFERGRVRQPLGSLSVITGMFGLIAAREAIFHILAITRSP